MNNSLSNPHLNTFVNFLNTEVSEELRSKMSEFLTSENFLNKPREVIFDRGEIIFVRDGKQMASYAISAHNDRVVHFNGQEVWETNPYAYLDDRTLEMKGDDSTASVNRRSGTSASVTNSNNNNNNNNNNG